MKLVLQCAVCGTNHPVGTEACPTCRATGVQNLRLMFECPACFRLGLLPSCAVCNPLPYEVVQEPEEAEASLNGEVLLSLDDDEELSLDDDDGFEFTLDDE